MAWERAIDRLLLRQVHLAERGDLSENEVRNLVLDQLELTGEHPKTWFHAGYARTYLGLDLPEPENSEESRRWFQFGRFRAHFRKGESHWMADLVEDESVLLELMHEPAIAAQILPSLMDLFFKDGQFEKAVWVLRLLEGDVGEEGRRTELSILLEAALSDLLTRLERARIAAEHEGSVRRALRSAMDTEAYEALSGNERARFLLALGLSALNAGEWDDATTHFDEALALSEEGSGRIHRSLLCKKALATLRVLDLEQLEPQCDRGPREAALALYDQALDAGPMPEASFGRGILLYETGAYLAASGEFETASRQLREEVPLNEGLFHRARFYLGASLLAAGDRGEVHRAVRHLEETLDKVRPDLASFYPVYDSLKEQHQKVALCFLDALELGRGTSSDDLLLVALEYLGLGEPSRALEAAARVLTITQDLDQRVEALKARLCAHNMQGNKDEARQDYFECRDLLQQRGAFEELEQVLKNEALVGQALDHLEIKCELADLYEEMEGREWERSDLRLQIARGMKARKELEDLEQALAILREVEIDHPELCKEELESLEKLLALKACEVDRPAQGDEAGLFAEISASLGHPARVLVVGGNERQRKHHSKLYQLGESWGFEGEWLMANYASPQKTVSAIQDRMRKGKVDLLVLLHWNRHETTEPALELARAAELPARTLFYAGFTSLHVGLVDLAQRVLKKATAG